MKKNISAMQRGGLAALVLTLAVALSACGGGNGAGGTDAAAIMQQAEEKLAAVESMSYQMSMDMQMSAAGESMTIKMTGDVDYITSPVAMRMNMNMDMGAQGAAAMQLYLQQQDGAYMMYGGVDDGSGTVTWSAQPMTDMTALAQYDAKANMDLYLKSGNSFAAAGTEAINGSAATRYDGIISGDALTEVMQSSGVLDQFTGLGLDEETINSFSDQLGDLPVSIWVDETSGLPVRYDMDMTAMMQSMMDNMLAAAGSTETLTIDQVALSMTLGNFNGVSAIEIPAEALAAAE